MLLVYTSHLRISERELGVWDLDVQKQIFWRNEFYSNKLSDISLILVRTSSCGSYLILGIMKTPSCVSAPLVINPSRCMVNSHVFNQFGSLFP